MFFSITIFLMVCKKALHLGNVHKGYPIFFLIFGDTYLPMSYTLCTIYLCTMSDFPWHTYLPKNRTSLMNVPLWRPYGEQIIYEGVFNFFHPSFSLDWKEYECSLRTMVLEFNLLRTSVLKLFDAVSSQDV